MANAVIIHQCNNNYHGSISEALSFDGCPDCGRNYDYEGFLRACKKLNIDPSIIDPCNYPRNNNGEL